MKKTIIFGLLLTIFLFGCTSEFKTMDDTQATSSGVEQVVNANNQFAFDMYNKIDNDKNVFFSPYSISTALAMTYEGANGQTKEEIKNVFYFPDDQTLRSSNARIYNLINKDNKKYELNTANALWAQKDYDFLPTYFNTIENYYGGKVTNLDFVTQTEESRQTINKWVEDQTNDKIKNLIEKGMLNAMTRLVLTNAIYFKGTWEWEFDKSDTSNQDFKITSDNVVKTPMMFMEPDKARFNYANLEKLQILELPYKGNDISMLILLPKQGPEYDFDNDKMITHDYTLKDIELSSEKLKEYRSQMKETKLDAIYLPKFEFDTKYLLNNALKSLGMPTAFSMDADFSGMDGTKDLFISNVIHQAFVKVDEKGTEAAAATAVTMELKSAMPTNIFRADHPFIFIIQERSTGNILFMGKVVDPTI